MIYAIYKLSQKAIDERMDWDEAFDNDEFEIVEEFDSLEECEKAWDDGWYDDELYGRGGLNRTTYIF